MGDFLRPNPARTTRTTINVAVAGNTTILSTAVNLWRLFLITADAVTVRLQDQSGAISPPFQFFGQGGTLMLPFDTEPWFIFGAGGLILNLSAAVTVTGMAYTT